MTDTKETHKPCRSDAEALFLQNMELAHFTLWRRFPDRAKDEDSVQIALLGLWKACLTYDEGRGAFSTYAVSCCCHEILREYRDHRQRLDVLSMEESTADGLTL